MKKIKKHNRGYSLIEILISITILGIVMVSLLSYFSTAIKANMNAQKLQQTTMMAQTVMERCKDSSLLQIETMYPDVIKEESDGKYIYKFKNIAYDRYKGDIKIEIGTKESTAYETINDKEVIKIAGINYPESIAITETLQDELALNYFKSKHLVACDDGVGLVPLGDNEIKKKINKILYMDLTKFNGSSDVATLDVYYTYYCDILGSTNKTPDQAINFHRNLYSKNIPINDLKRVFIFYKLQENTTPLHVKMNIEPDLKNKFDTTKPFRLFLIAQEYTGTTTSMKLEQSGVPFANDMFYLYTNIGFSNVDKSGALIKEETEVVEKAKLNKISNIKVGIYESGSGFLDSNRIVHLDSTRGE